MRHLLVVDDDAEFRETLIRALRDQGYRATGLDDPDGLIASLEIYRPDVILLDMMFDTGVSGLEVCQRLRRRNAIPVVILSVLNDEETKVKVLDAGADDYLAKPFGINELLARVRAVERRLTNRLEDITPIVTIGDLTIDFESRLTTLNGRLVQLSRKEYSLLKVLIEAQGRLVTYEKLISTLWPGEQYVRPSKLRTLVMQLRNTLDEDLSSPKYIFTEAGVGYRLNWDMPKTTGDVAS